jgi:hypothetical protein
MQPGIALQALATEANVILELFYLWIKQQLCKISTIFPRAKTERH